MSHRIVGSLTAAILLLASRGWAQSAAKEPVADGRTLSEWVADLKAAAPQVRNAAAYEICSTGSLVWRKNAAFSSSAASYCAGTSTSRNTASTGQTTTHCSHSMQMSGSI